MILIAALLASGQSDFPVRGDTGRKCDAGPVGALIGRRRSARVEVEALRLSGAGAVRWIRPGKLVTMDYRADRLDLRLDRRGRIVRAACG
jgi:hypothetical protein